MAYAIMRCKKLASMGSVAGALKHCFRERPTPNADPAKTPRNTYRVAQSTDEAMGKLRELLPEKRRKDAVLCVEYLMTASPEWWGIATKEQKLTFFNRCAEWLDDKFGRENIITAAIHLDETSPHLSAFVVPLTADRRLSAKEFIGNKAKMSQDQTTFAEKMKDLGLERGVKRSQARHTTIREYYAHANATELLKTQRIALPEAKLLEGKESYGMRCSQNVLDILNPQLQRATAKAMNAAKQIEAAHREKDKAEAQAVEARNVAHNAQIGQKHAQNEVENLREWQRKVQNVIVAGGEPLQNLHERFKRTIEQQQEQPKRGISR